MQTCKAKTRTGTACRAPAGSGGLCFFHANPDSAKALGQIGGRKNRRSGVVDLQVPDNMNATDLRNLTTQAIRLLLAGELQARDASALVQLCNSLYRVIQAVDLETRVATLEANETGPAAGTDALLAAEQRIPCPTDADGPARTHGGDGTESGSNESDEAREA